MKPTSKTAAIPRLAVIFTLVLSACSAPLTPNPTVDVAVFYTQAAATIVQGITQTAAAMPSVTLPPPTATLKPVATPTQSPTPGAPGTSDTPIPAPQPVALSPTVDPATAFGCYNATLIADVTIQYAPTFNPGDRFTKTWRVKNSGSCDWPRGFIIAFVSGDRFGADTRVIDQKVSAGALAEISLAMTAPNLTGVVNSNWQLATNIGKTFGQVLSVAITLPASVSSTASGGGCLNSELESDLTIPTGTEMKTNTSFTKTWRIKNTGTCKWNGNFKITYVGGDLLGSDTIKIRQTVGPGSSAEISLEMTAPGTPGTVSSAWQLASDDGQLFGQLFAFSITVK